MSPAPVLTPFAQELYDALAPWADQDAALGYPLANYCGAIAAQFDQIELYARDRDTGEPGWSLLLDPNVAPPETLDWLAQFAGVTLDKSMTIDQQRAAIKGTSAFQRGTPAAIKAAAARYLTGTKSVFFNERVGNDAYALGVTTLVSETPDPAATLKAILQQKPAGILLTYSTVVGTDYGTLLYTHSTYSQLSDGRFATYAAMAANPSL